MTTDVVAPFLNAPTTTTTSTTTSTTKSSTSTTTTTTTAKPTTATTSTVKPTTKLPTSTTTTSTKSPTTTAPTAPTSTTTTLPATTTTSTTTTTTSTKSPTTTPTTPTTTTTNPPLTCAGPIDLVFVIDASDTMTAARFNIVKSQLALAITQSSIVWGNNNAHVGIVLSTGLNPGWRTTPYRYIDFNGCQFTSDGCTPTITSTATLITAIQNMPFYGGKNNIYLSMSETMTGEFEGLPDSWYIFGEPYWGTVGDRSNVADVMIVISGNDNSNVTAATQELLNKGVKIYAIGFSDLPNTQLQAISGNPARSFSTTPQNLASAIKNICSHLN
uniref:VWFA domain-containing protein n=1 Tax=Panagrolaimus sp. ES5 TaxID=591445 RepID=A0AC34G3B6_9BILA